MIYKYQAREKVVQEVAYNDLSVLGQRKGSTRGGI